MERFAFKIDAALKANLYKICRLCGIDNPSKVSILSDEDMETIDVDEPSLSQKIHQLVGFTVTQNDKMPQTMCTLCVDKINDFYEFREMCYATNKQTRNLLGLKQADPERPLDVKPILKSDPLLMTPTTTSTPTGNKRGRKRKTEDNGVLASSSNSTNMLLESIKNEPIALRKKQRLTQPQQLLAGRTEIKDEPVDLDDINKVGVLAKKARKASCNVCGERFKNKDAVDKHKGMVHVPTVPRYLCNACNQIHQSPSDIKAHQLWHKLSRTPYLCPLCDASISNNYAFTRHLREHTTPTPIALLVLDRECPLCKKTFLTNYFYNTHPCARKTKKCGGCSRTLNTDNAYMKHAPHCAKIYLSHSKHIMPEVSKNEAQMRIKNENDLEPEDNGLAAIRYPADDHMQPVVVLERLSSPLLRASSAPNTLGKNNDRVSTKSYMKRVDQLLKNTMSTLVSIKHEPEVHIDDAGLALATAEQPDSGPDDDDDAAGGDDFHADSGDDSDEEVSPVKVKQEPTDELNVEEATPSSDGVHIKQEPLKLKLKITKNHGQLNSSLVDEDNDMQQHSKSGKRNKKKRKHKERSRDATEESETNTNATQESSPETESNSKQIVNVKQERQDNSYVDSGASHFEPQATVMTSIPIMQLTSSCNPEDQHELTTPESEDVKPNRLELDRLMQITHIASGVVMAEETMPPEKAVEAVPNENPDESPSNPATNKPTKSTARKRTGGVPREAQACTSNDVPGASPEMQLPKIVAVKSAVNVPFKMVAIKPEPRNRGYMDEQPEQAEDKSQEEENQQQEQAEQDQEEQELPSSLTASPNEINHNDKQDDEAAYINSLDLNNITIKQERDLHISDVELNGSEADNVNYNGLHAIEQDDDDADDSASSADEAEEHMDTFEEQEEERIYQEIELQPLEEQTPEEEQLEDSAAPVEETNVQQDEDMTPAEENLPEGKFDEDTEEQSEGKLDEAREEQEQLLAIEQESQMHVQPNGEQQLQIEETHPDEQPTDESELRETAATMPAFNFVITRVCSQAVPAVVTAREREEDGREQSSTSADAEIQATPALSSDSSPQPFIEPLPQASTEAPQSPPQPPKSPPQSSCQLSPLPSLPSPQTTAQGTTDCSATFSLDKADPNPEQLSSPIVTLNAPKDSEAMAQPFFEDSSTSYNCDEEQQNVLNHELSAMEQQQLEMELEVSADDNMTVEEEAEAAVTCRVEQPGANEETENRINEQQQQQQEQEQEQLQQLRCELNNDSNINEIAENNNNANIERELNDDANVAQEDANP